MSNETTFLYVWISSLTKIYCILKPNEKLYLELIYDDNFLYNFFTMHFNFNNVNCSTQESNTPSDKVSQVYCTLYKIIDQFGLNQSKTLKSIFKSLNMKESKLKIWKLIFTVTFLEDFYFLLKTNSIDKTFNNEKSFFNHNEESSIINYNHNIPKKLTILSIMKSIILFKLSNSIIYETLSDTEVGYSEIENLIQTNFNETLNESKLEIIYNMDKNQNDITHFNENNHSNNVSINNETVDINYQQNLLATDRSQRSNFLFDSEKKEFSKKYKAKCEKCDLHITKLNENEKKLESLNENVMNLKNFISKYEEENKNYKNYINVLHNEKTSIENNFKIVERKLNLAKNNDKIINELSQEVVFLNKKINESTNTITELNEKIAYFEDNDNLLKEYKTQLKILKNDNKKIKSEKIRTWKGVSENIVKTVENFEIYSKRPNENHFNSYSNLKSLNSNFEIINKSNISRLQGLLKNKNEIIDLKSAEIEKLNKLITDHKVSMELKENILKMSENTISNLIKRNNKCEAKIKHLNASLSEKTQEINKKSSNLIIFIIFSVLVSALVFICLHISLNNN